MKKGKIMLSAVCGTLSLILCFNFAGCVANAEAVDLMEGITPNEVSEKSADEAFVSAYNDFAFELFKAADEEENSLVSPFSVMAVLAMIANGADGETKEEMEQVLGGGIPLETLNEYLSTYIKALPSGDDYTLKLANSIWYRDDIVNVKNDFLQTNADYYGAGIFKIPFDNSAIDSINGWVSDNTDGMIDKMVERIDPNTFMFLLNAMTFDANWQSKYSVTDVADGEFTNYNGGKTTVPMMSSKEYIYINNNLSEGFIKNYCYEKYSFAALLPNENVDIDSFVEALTGGEIANILNNAQKDVYSIDAKMPKFSLDYSKSLNEVLKELGMPSAFEDGNPNFARMVEDDIGVFINEVLHKTHIEVGEEGTKAAAATKGEMNYESAAIEESFDKTIELDRPFVYMIVDNANNIPLFIGVVKNL